MAKRPTRREWTKEDVRELKALARQKTPVAKIAKSLKRTPGATKQKAFTLGVSLICGSDALALLNEPHCCHSNRIHDGSAQFEPCRGGFLVNADLRSFTVTRRLPHRMAARLSRVQSPPSGKQGKGPMSRTESVAEFRTRNM